MTKDEFTAVMNKIKEKSTDDTGEVANLLADLYDGFDGVVNECTTLKATNTELSTKNTTLQEQNMKLYLRVGQPESNNGNKTGKDDEELKYENLFNEEGELK